MKAIIETNTLFKRNLLLSIRSMETLLSGILTPAILMILFVYVFGGAMNVGDTSYVDFVVPGVLVQCIAQSASSVGVTVTEDLKSGMVERLMTLNISNSAFLNGHVFAATLRSLISTLVVLIVAMVIGFRPQATVAGWGLAFLLIFCFTIAFTWGSVLVGLIAKSPETATLFTVLITLLPYLSSGFVPTETMPRPLAVFAEYQPMSPIIHSLRGLLLNLKDTTLISAFSWCGGIVVVSWFLARMLYQKRLR